jgi:dTDP-4-dehydrorhamnose reductase
MKTVLVFGGNGQLGESLQREIAQNPINGFECHFFDIADADITSVGALEEVFKKYTPAYTINCAAYTAVDTAEDDTEKAFAINEVGTKNIATLCTAFNSCFIHISTDFIFDGSKLIPLKETDITSPLGVYGLSKLKGEEAIISSDCAYYIIRTSWLYSEFQANFLKTMLHLAQTRDTLSVVADQVGTPTYAGDLASIICTIIKQQKTGKEIYHYSNEGVASWHDFAHEIFEKTNTSITLLPILTAAYPTKATRPPYSVLDKSKIKDHLAILIPHWKESLQKCLNHLNN